MNKMSTKHLIFFIIAVSIIALRSYSSIFINYGGRDSGLISIIACIFIGIYFTILMSICEKTNCYNFLDMIKRSFSKPIASIIILIFSIGLFLASIEASSVEASSIHTNFFLSTPTWYCLLFFIIPGAYVLNKNFSSLVITVIISVSLVLIGDIILFALLAKYLDFDYLLPILKDVDICLNLTSNTPSNLSFKNFISFIIKHHLKVLFLLKMFNIRILENTKLKNVLIREGDFYE